MWSPSNDAEIPEYYRQWAAAIGRLSPKEQMRTLAQMSEEDRLIVQRLMDRSSMQASGARAASRPEVSGPAAFWCPPARLLVALRLPLACCMHFCMLLAVVCLPAHLDYMIVCRRTSHL